MIQRQELAYCFAGFELQPAERRLIQGGTAIALTPKAFDILLLLVERAGHVVTKDDLMAVIWSGRSVAESNLTKHIWTLRQALGESEEGGRFIETVPKIGYRFVAPVAASAPSAPAPAAAIPAAERPTAGVDIRKPGRFHATIALAASGFAIAALLAWWFWNGREAVFPWSGGAPGTAIAVFDFDNLSRSAKTAWIGPAFSEMLGTDMAQGGRLHLLPGELIRSTRGNAVAPDAGGFGPETLATLRRQLAVDYVVTGSYLATDRPGDGPVRLDLAIQDARNGTTLATFSQTGSLNDLAALVMTAGDNLRRRLKLKAPDRQEVRLAANAQPPTTDVMRRIGFALDALHHYNPAVARDELLQAIVEAPDYALSYVYLAKAWTALGYNQKALAASREAAAHSADLPQAMRLQIDVQSYEAQFAWGKAIATLRDLQALQPDDPEVQLELANVLSSAGKAKDAQAVLDTLRQKGEPVASDARLELAQAHIAASQDDTSGQVAHARHALELAQSRGATGLTADAEIALGAALTASDPKAANIMLGKALADYRRISNPSGEASVHLNLGNLYMEAQPQRALREYQESLVQFQAMGDQNGAASDYADLGILLWNAGDRDGATTAVRNVLRIRRETGDIRGQAWALAALAINESDERASDEAIAGLREAAALDASIGAHGHRGFSLFSLSDLLRLRGDFAQAQAACFEAQAENSKLKDVSAQPAADFACAQISLDRGDVSTVTASLERVRSAAARQKDVMTLGNVDVTQGKIAMGEGQWARADTLLGNAKNEFGQAEMATGEAVATSLLALCDDALGRTAQRDASVKHADELRGRMTERLELIQADIALAELRGKSGESDRAISQLEALADDARKRLWPGWALEAELAELHVLQKNKLMERAAVLRARIAAEARQQGFGWVLQRALRTDSG